MSESDLARHDVEPARPPDRFCWMRLAQVTAFVAIWGLLGVGLRYAGPSHDDGAYCYLLLGIPLVVAFQVLVRRRPLVTLWQRDADRFRLGKRGIACAVGLGLLPLAEFLGGLFAGLSWCIELFLAAALLGAIAAGYCLQSASRGSLRHGLPGFLAATLCGLVIMIGHALTEQKPVLPGTLQTGLMVEQFLILFVVCFVMEEVAFRGLVDAHLRPTALTRRDEWSTAIAVSLLWGVWHLPLLDAAELASPVTLAAVVAVHLAVGLPLSLCWRASGSLLFPAASHALIDAYRNGLGLMP